MRLVASLIVKDEMSRYIQVAIPHLVTFCDEVRVLDDGSTDGTFEYLGGLRDPVLVKRNPGPAFFEHEGRARQELLEWTLAAQPTHILAIDADELVGDPERLRDLPPSRSAVWLLTMEEVWKADTRKLKIRTDGAWKPRPVSMLYLVHRRIGRMADRALACGREPSGVRRAVHRAADTGTSVFHFGWTNEAARAKRYLRYEIADGGKFHASDHLKSIMFPDSQVEMEATKWPAGLAKIRSQILERVNLTTDATHPVPDSESASSSAQR